VGHRNIDIEDKYIIDRLVLMYRHALCKSAVKFDSTSPSFYEGSNKLLDGHCRHDIE
jgi:hypothetical protein